MERLNLETPCSIKSSFILNFDFKTRLLNLKPTTKTLGYSNSHFMAGEKFGNTSRGRFNKITYHYDNDIKPVPRAREIGR